MNNTNKSKPIKEVVTIAVTVFLLITLKLVTMGEEKMVSSVPSQEVDVSSSSEINYEIGTTISTYVVKKQSPPQTTSELVPDKTEQIKVTTTVKVTTTQAPKVTEKPTTSKVENQGSEKPPYDVRLDEDLLDYIYELCQINNVPYEIVLAVIECESGFNVNASNGTCIGLMQLHKSYFKGNLYDGYNNVKQGIEYLGRLNSKYGISQALVYYNCGEYSGIKAPSKYSNKVLEKSVKYK